MTVRTNVVRPEKRRGLRLALLALALVYPGAAASGQTSDEAADQVWQVSAFVDGYLVPDDTDYGAPTLFVNRGNLHLEARHNYEDFNTASLFAGWTFTFGQAEDYLKVTPMMGGFVGRSNGVAPGLEIEARWRRLAYWFETEYTIHPGDREENYFYSWSELNLFLLPKLWVGGSVQRLKLIESPREVDVGPMVGFGNFGTRGASLSLYAYGIATSAPSYLATLSVYF